MSSRSWFNGEACAAIAADNRAMRYGDGIFRTMLVWQSEVFLLKQQLHTAWQDAQQLGLRTPDMALVQQHLQAQAATMQAGVLRLSLIAPLGPRGYARSEAVADYLLQSAPLPEPMNREGIALCSLDWRLASQPALAGIKHLNRLDQVMARRHLPAGFQEGLLRSQAGYCVSGIMSNLFLWRRGQWMTPALQDCGVAGITRGWILDHLQTRGQAALLIEDCTEATLHDADFLFICNSLMGLVPIGLWQDTLGQQRRWNPRQILEFQPFAQLQTSLSHPLNHA